MTELGLLLEACGRCTLYECTGIGLLFVSPFLSFVQSLECHHAGTGEGDDRTNNETSYAVRMLCQVAPAPWFRQHCWLHLPQRRLASGSLHATRGLRRNQQSSVIWSFNVCRSDCRISRSCNKVSLEELLNRMQSIACTIFEWLGIASSTLNTLL